MASKRKVPTASSDTKSDQADSDEDSTARRRRKWREASRRRYEKLKALKAVESQTQDNKDNRKKNKKEPPKEKVEEEVINNEKNGQEDTKKPARRSSRASRLLPLRRATISATSLALETKKESSSSATARRSSTGSSTASKQPNTKKEKKKVDVDDPFWEKMKKIQMNQYEQGKQYNNFYSWSVSMECCSDGSLKENSTKKYLLSICRADEWIPWLEIRQSSIARTSWGLFAKRSFEEKDRITLYMGAMYPCRDQSLRPYCVKGMQDKAKKVIANNHDLLLGAHFVNTARDSPNAILGDDGFITAARKIESDDEIFIKF